MPEDQLGRVDGCRVPGRPTPDACYGCPAYRGIDRYGLDHPGVEDGEYVALTAAEHDASMGFDTPSDWLAAQGASPWSLRHSGTIEWDEHWAGYQRGYRARMTDPQRERQRVLTRLRVARLRARRRNVNPAGGP